MAFAAALLAPPCIFAAQEQPVPLPEFVVEQSTAGTDEFAIPRRAAHPLDVTLAPQLQAIPGVYLQARAADAAEPSLRGLSFDRVTTTLDGIPLLNASPERTFSPVATLGPVAVTHVQVAKALPSVMLGPVTTGGCIALSTAPDQPAVTGISPLRGDATATWDFTRSGLSTALRAGAGAGRWFGQVSSFTNDLGDYTAADGRIVAAQLVDSGASASLGWQIPGHQARLFVFEHRLRRQEAVSLPLDAKDSESQALTFNDSWEPSPMFVERIDWRVGGSWSDPYITSEDRIGAPLTAAHATARSTAGAVDVVWRVSKNGTVATGADYRWQLRRAVRTSPSGNDYIWPGAVYTDTGAFAEWNTALGPRSALRLGARMDDVRSNARDADQLALGRSVREQYIAYNGTDAGNVSRRDTAGAANALLDFRSSETCDWFLGAGMGAQPAPVTERYRAMLNALGGDGRGGNAVELGNPALAAERSSVLEAGLTRKFSWFDFNAVTYWYRVDDFILRTPIGVTTPPLARMVVFGYRNVDADFFGGELTGVLRPMPGWSVPATLAISRGRRRDSAVGLAEMPPWDATVAVRYVAAPRGVTAELGTRVVGEKRNPAPLDNPLFIRTGGFALWHIQVSAPLSKRLRFEWGVENMFNRLYSEYLTPPVAPMRPASGNLSPNDRVPGRGRSACATLVYTF